MMRGERKKNEWINTGKNNGLMLPFSMLVNEGGGGGGGRSGTAVCCTARLKVTVFGVFGVPTLIYVQRHVHITGTCV